MRDMRELMHGQHLSPNTKRPDVLAGIWRRGPENDHRPIDEREREPIRDRVWVLDHDVDARRRRISNDTSNRRVDGIHARTNVARPWLQRLAEKAPHVLREKPVLLIWGVKDPAFGSQAVIDRWKTYFPRAEVVVLPHASHYIQEDAPDEIASAVTRRFGA